MPPNSADADAEDGHIIRRLSPAAKRLFWTLSGPLESEGAIRVASSPYWEPNAEMQTEPYFQGYDNDDNNGAPIWHNISRESLMEPGISSLTVRICALDAWEALWVEMHSFCGEGMPHDWHPNRFDGASTPSDDGSEEEEEETGSPKRELQRCCGQERPWTKDNSFQVTAAAQVLTLHEYVSAVHPWLMGMRGRILDAMGRMNGQNRPKPADTKLAVLDFGPGPLTIDYEARWPDWHQKPRIPRQDEVTMTMDKARNEEVSRGLEERYLARAAVRIKVLEAEAAAPRQDTEGP